MEDCRYSCTVDRDQNIQAFRKTFALEYEKGEVFTANGIVKISKETYPTIEEYIDDRLKRLPKVTYYCTSKAGEYCLNSVINNLGMMPEIQLGECCSPIETTITNPILDVQSLEDDSDQLSKCGIEQSLQRSFVSSDRFHRNQQLPNGAVCVRICDVAGCYAKALSNAKSEKQRIYDTRYAVCTEEERPQLGIDWEP